MTSNGNAAPAPDAERKAFAALYELHHRALYRYCRSIVRHEHDAQDAMQSTMTRAYAALQSEPRDFDLRPWLFHIAHNESVSILRRRRPVVALDGELADAGAIDDRIEARETLRLLRQDLADLPRRQRTALILRELNGLRPAEIAALLETTPGAAKQAILDARRALSKCDEGRATPCFEVQRALSDGDGRVMRGRGLRAHLRSCPSCRRFNADMVRRPSELAALAPALPAGAGAGLLAALHGSAGALAGRVLAKVAIGAVVVTATAATGVHSLHHGTRAPGPPARVAPASTSEPSTHAVARIPAPRETTAPAPLRAPARRPAKARARVKTPAAATAPRPATGTPAPTAQTAPAQPEPAMSNAAAPGQATKPSEPTVPPGQATKQTGAVIPPGQAKKQTDPVTPPGQAKKQTDPVTPPGQAKKQADPAPPPAPADPAGTAAPAPSPSAPGNSGNAPGHAPGGPHGAAVDGGTPG